MLVLPFGSSRVHAALCCGLLAWCACRPSFLVEGKTVSGDFVLSGAKSERVMTSFAVFPEGGRLKVTLSSRTAYPDDSHLKVRLYVDDDWPKYQRALTCHDKAGIARETMDVSFERVNAVDHRVYEATVQILTFTTALGGRETKDSRPHYWYFVVDDCSLEEYFQDNAVPEVHFELVVFNHLEGRHGEVTHLSADEHHLTVLHTVTLVASGLVAFLLVMNAVLKLLSGRATVHLAVLWVAAAAGLDAGSSLFELMHLQIYKSNGVGSYWVDAISAHLEALCDALLVLLLLSIAAGWTLPSDVIPISAPTNPNHFQRLVADLGRPASCWGRVHALGGTLSIAVVALHVVLAQWGRTYNDNFDSYHDFEHPPGKVLMVGRIMLGLLFLVASVQTRNKCQSPKLVPFYVKLSALGFVWFLSLPFLTWMCGRYVPYYLRHPAVFITSAVAQSTCIVLLAWLVTAHSTAYHRVSHITSPGDSSLTDELLLSTMPTSESKDARTWTLGKGKVRLD
jgi:Rhodopsin-like GPCR transmembrane domain